MPSCAYCGTRIFFGGVGDGDARFCNEECADDGALVDVAREVPSDVVTSMALEIRRGPCPACSGPGPVDAFTTYRVWSALVYTQWSSRPFVGCGRCGVRKRLADAAYSLLLGWWAFPAGLVMTPIQVFRNVAGLFRGGVPATPSRELRRLVRLGIAADAMEETAHAAG